MYVSTFMYECTQANSYVRINKIVLKLLRRNTENYVQMYVNTIMYKYPKAYFYSKTVNCWLKVEYLQRNTINYA